MNETDFKNRLDAAFGSEPPHPPIERRIAGGRRILRRQRLSAVGAGVAAVTVVGWSMHAVTSRETPDFAGIPTYADEADLVTHCISDSNLVTNDVPGWTPQWAADTFEGADVMTSATSEDGLVATLRSGDGAYWAACDIAQRGDATTTVTQVFSTEVHADRQTVKGVEAYAPWNEADPYLNAEGSTVELGPDCETTAREESAEMWQQLADCPTYRFTWNDRRPSQVAAATVTTPDGATLDAVVSDGYLSFSYVGQMTPQLRQEYLSQHDLSDPVRVTFFNDSGDPIARSNLWGSDRIADLPAVDNFPSLAEWTSSTS